MCANPFWMVVLLWLSVSVAQAAESSMCISCHSESLSSLADTAHQTAPQSPACGDCHDAATAHLAAPMDPAARPVAAPADESCTGCHAAQRHADGAHVRAGMNCVNCHRIHEDGSASAPATAATSRFPDLAPGSRGCLSCHEHTFTEFAFNENHRVLEGSLGCSDCHDPHAPAARTDLGGFGNHSCGNCHQEAVGPFVFEHRVSRIDGCEACHAPHGSPNRHLLTHQRVAELCYGCHTAVPDFHFGFSPAGPPRFDLDSQCTNCHVTIHGSNIDRYFLK